MIIFALNITEDREYIENTFRLLHSPLTFVVETFLIIPGSSNPSKLGSGVLAQFQRLDV